MHKYKPAAPARAHLLAAALLWTLVGGGLFTAGLAWSHPASRPWMILVAAVAVSLGLLKARLVLRRTADRAVRRICERGDGRCLGGFLSWRMWSFVAGMMLLGRVLRSGPVPRPVVAFIYEAVGAALLVGAFTFWRAYSQGCRDASS
jgi:hypothetical protein